jgi:hypothetical protein
LRVVLSSKSPLKDSEQELSSSDDGNNDNQVIASGERRIVSSGMSFLSADPFT